MSRTTPPRPLVVTALFPQLAPLARTATRLHPRAGSPSRHDSSVGGPLLWPADEPWPFCEGPHTCDQVGAAFSLEGEREDRGIVAPGTRQDDHDEYDEHEADDWAFEDLADGDQPWPGGPIAMLPVAQLYLRDIPSLRPPGQVEADLLQVLWCPFDHPEHPRTALFWRSAATVTDVLEAPPEPPAVEFPGYLPQPCLLSPEEVTEYPGFPELGKELQEQLADWDRWQAAGAAVDASYAVAPDSFYTNKLSVSPGWKVGGWSRWGLTDPVPRTCSACGAGLEPLLTIASTEWNSGTESWAPEGDGARDPLPPGVPPANYTRTVIAGGHSLQLHACPVSADHPHLELIQ
ncbi:hypothetical protein [Streptomyces sp. AC602_WCS936]|uniref:hypothetical protein n=1 Tax=Streptomyces sp. AC602_WCS936 TaxID=2823685 RepID=UPI001C25A609|nr:hypothetical protein [Streptomyces sp. AC602_WCS936]